MADNNKVACRVAAGVTLHTAGGAAPYQAGDIVDLPRDHPAVLAGHAVPVDTAPAMPEAAPAQP